ncbi:MAG TPA: hypothetical protein VMR86_18995, partial [Myxococcota bacterium]|nr:hypothetical protein [Myxococcota bacterium]
MEEVREFSLTESGVQIDAQNRPHFFVGGDRVYHYWQDGGSWHSEVVDSHPRSGEHLRAAEGPSGDFHLIYDRIDLAPESTEHSRSFLITRQYATDRTGTWQIEEVPQPPGDEGNQYRVVTGLVVDASHVPHLMSFSNNGVTERQDLFLQSRPPGGWVIERINDDRQAHTATRFSASSQLAIDGSGRLHAIWFTASGPEQLIYSFRDDQGWHHEPVTSVGDTTLLPAKDPSALVVDAAGTAHVVFVNQSPASDGYWHLVHLERSPAGWRLDDLGLGGGNLVAALDAAGRAHVVFSSQLPNDPNTNQERYVGVHARETDAGWVREDITPASPIDFWWNVNLSLRVDALGRLSVGNLLDTAQTRRLALFQRDSDWTSSAVAESGPVTFDDDYSFVPGASRVGSD